MCAGVWYSRSKISFLGLSVCLPACLPVCLPVCLSVSLAVHLAGYLSVCLYACLSVSLWADEIIVVLPVMTDVDNSTQPSHQQQDVHNMTSLSGQTFSNITSTDAPSSAAISTAIVILLSSVVVVLLLIVLVLLLLWKKESVMNCFSCFRKQRASRKSNGSVVLESGGLDDVANGRRLAAQGTMPYLEEEVANSRNGNSHPAHDTSQNGNSDANHNVPVCGVIDTVLGARLFYN